MHNTVAMRHAVHRDSMVSSMSALVFAAKHALGHTPCLTQRA
jgi:hypothetical protein